MLVPTVPRFYTVAEVEADPVRLNSGSGPTPISSTCSTSARSPSPGPARRRAAVERDPDRAGRRGRPHRRRRRAIHARSGASVRAAPRQPARRRPEPDRIEDRGRRRASLGPAAQSRARRTRRGFLARSRDDARTTVCYALPTRLRPSPGCCGSATARAPRSRPRSGRWSRRPSAPSSPGSRRRSASARSGSGRRIGEGISGRGRGGQGGGGHFALRRLARLSQVALTSETARAYAAVCLERAAFEWNRHRGAKRRGDPEAVGRLITPGLLRFARNDDRG